MKRWGSEVVFGTDGIDAVTLCFHHLPQLVILSEGLAKMKEAQVVDTLKSDPLTAKMKVVFSGNVDSKFNIDSEEFPFDAILTTPIERESFDELMRKLGMNPLPPAKKVA